MSSLTNRLRMCLDALRKDERADCVRVTLEDSSQQLRAKIEYWATEAHPWRITFYNGLQPEAFASKQSTVYKMMASHGLFSENVRVHVVWGSESKGGYLARLQGIYEPAAPTPDAVSVPSTQRTNLTFLKR